MSAPAAQEAADDTPAAQPRPSHIQGSIVTLALAALGVVYGDIGTSPLYALRECFVGGSALPITAPNVLGVLSLVFWSLTMVVSIKYLTFLMRADNEGEGGILALLALLAPKSNGSRRRNGLLLVGLFGAALLYGDGVITPAISVLSAVEGLRVATDAFEPFILPISVGLLVALFLVQRRGTAGIGAVFGPAMLVWFATIGALGLGAILRQDPHHASVLSAVNPLHAVSFFVAHRVKAFLALGAVVLCVTGSEALYADMGHFGAPPIRLAWYAVALPALLFNYFGQGALLLAGGAEVTNPFYQLAPSWGLYPLVALSTVATVIASQALISGAFSLTQQAVQLSYAPRLTIIHTSGTAAGQIYVPEVNWALMVVACVSLVLGFKSSSNLAGAYGIAVTGTMIVTTLLFYVLTRENWRWSVPRAGALLLAFLLFDVAFFTANLPKVVDGGWFPLLVGLTVFTILTTWKRGRGELGRILAEESLPTDLFLSDLASRKPHRVQGTAVVMTSTPRGVPPVLLHHLKHNRSLHRRVVLLSITAEKRPEVDDHERLKITDLGQGFYRVVARFGFIETPQISKVIALCQAHGLGFDIMSTTFVLGRETLLPTGRSRMAKWRKRLYAFLARNAPSATAYFDIPPNRVIELGAQIEL